MPRIFAAYILFAALLMFIGGTVAWFRYHSHQRTYDRRMRREAREDAQLK